MAYNYDVSPIEYLTKRLNFYRKRISVWQYRIKHDNYWKGREDEIEKSISHFKERYAEFQRAILKLKP